MRRKIDDIEIKEPPLEELSKKHSCFKRTCVSCCSFFIVIIIGSLIVLKFTVGPKTKDLKQSTKQRFVAINFSYPSKDIETQIIMKEAGIEQSTAQALTQIGAKIRNAKGKGLEEGASTRLLINAGKFIRKGISPLVACEAAILNPITDDVEAYRSVHDGLADVVRSFFPE